MFLKYNLTVFYFLIDAVQQRFAANNIFTIARRVVDGQVSSLFVDFSLFNTLPRFNTPKIFNNQPFENKPLSVMIHQLHFQTFS